MFGWIIRFRKHEPEPPPPVPDFRTTPHQIQRLAEIDREIVLEMGRIQADMASRLELGIQVSLAERSRLRRIAQALETFKSEANSNQPINLGSAAAD